MPEPILIAAADVVAALDYPGLIECLRAAFRADCVVPQRHRHAIPSDATPHGIMLIKPAWRPGGPTVVKVVSVFPGNAARGLASVLGTVMLFHGETGAPMAVIDGQALTVRRTAAASALAADYLARRDAATMLMVGTGRLAPELVRAHATVRAITEVLVWGRDGGKAARLAGMLRADGLAATAVADLDAAVARADIISCATLAKEPLVRGALLRPGAHLDLVGSYAPDMREADDDAMRRGRIHVDTRAGALGESGDLLLPLANGTIRDADIVGELAELCRGTVGGRGGDDEITVFKSVGTALEDLAAAELALHAMLDAGAARR